MSSTNSHNARSSKRAKKAVAQEDEEEEQRMDVDRQSSDALGHTQVSFDFLSDL